MISSYDLAMHNTGPARYLWRDPEEKIVCYQLAGNDADKLARATRVVSRAGADIVDLNCGCPVKKIRSKKQGSRLLSSPETIYQFITAMKNSTDAAISIKIRVGEPHFDSDDVAVALAAESAGASFITVHGRHWTERYDSPSRPDPIAKIVRAVKLPVIANGDVCDVASALTLFNHTGCAGIMIARASVGNPWIFAEIQHALNDTVFTPPTLEFIGDVFKEHLTRLSVLENEKSAVLQSRALAKYYARRLPNRDNFVLAAQNAETMLQQLALIDRYFKC